MYVLNNSGDMSSSASPDEGTIPSKEFRKRQVIIMKAIWNIHSGMVYVSIFV